MKKKLKPIKQKLIKQSIYFCLAILITLGISVSAQSLFAMWINPDKIPPDGNLPAPINVSDVAQYKIGNLSIGTSVNPSQTLEVRNDTASTSRIRITDINQNPELQLQYNDNDSEHWAVYNNKSNNNSLNIWGNGSDRLTILQNGNIGIGTSSPNSLLHLYNTINNSELDIQSVAGLKKHWGIYQDRKTEDLMLARK